MARPLRIDFEGAFHHVTNRGARKQQIFLCDEDRFDMLDLIGKAHERFGIVLHSFCFMGNHVHFIIETPEANLSKALHLIEGTYAQRFNRRHGFDGPLLKGRFYSKLIQTDGYLDRAVRYVERNPLVANLVADLEQYPWSSYHLFCKSTVARPVWLSDRALSMSGVTGRTALRRFIYSTDPRTEIDLEDYPAAIGSDDFIAAALERSAADPQTAGQERAARVRPSLQELEGAVIAVFGEPSAGIRTRSQGTGNPARAVAIGLSQDIAGVPLAAIADRFNLSSAQSAGVIATRFRRRERGDEVFALRVEQVRQLLLDGRSDAVRKRAC